MLATLFLCCLVSTTPVMVGQPPQTGGLPSGGAPPIPTTDRNPGAASNRGASRTPEPAGADLSAAAKQVIERAIEAHGGKALLSKVHADRVKLKGKLVVDKVEVPYSAETAVQLPNQFRNTIQFNQGKKDVVMTQVLNGESVAVWINGKQQKIPPAMEEEIRQNFALNRAIRMLALLEDPGYELKYLGKDEDPARVLHVVRINHRGLRELRMFFESGTGLLVKTEHPVDYQGKQYLQEERYSDFRSLSGFRRPVKMEVIRGGQKLLEASLTEVHYPESLPPELFATETKP